MSALVASEGLESGRLAVVKIAGLELETSLFMAYDTDRPATRAQVAFWDWAFSAENEAIRQRSELPVEARIRGAG